MMQRATRRRLARLSRLATPRERRRRAGRASSRRCCNFLGQVSPARIDGFRQGRLYFTARAEKFNKIP